MQLNDFLIRFQLQPLVAKNIRSAPHTPNHREAAVLIAIQEIDRELHLVLTRRPLHLRHHPGQISFPGGKIEKSDGSPICTALREANEEIGLPSSHVSIIGSFPSHRTLTGFSITPVVGVITQPFELILDPGEVDSCFTVPLAFFIRRERHFQKHHWHKGRPYLVHFMPYQDKLIWGATAAMIDLLCRHLTND